MRLSFSIIKIAFIFIPFSLFAQARINQDSAFVADNYNKIERMIPMRDGVRLFTSIYIPKDENEKYPFLMERTPYSCAPYGEKNLKKGWLGPNRLLTQEKYIFVYQDVRGRYKSEGNFEEMTPAIDHKKSKKDVDESSDTYDTIDWLLKNIKNNNGKVGICGISYIGFFASASLPDAHPAIKAVSPQAPMSDEFIGDDVYHNGAFFLMDNFDFSVSFLGERIDSNTKYKDLFDYETKDAYSFYKNLEPLKNTNDSIYFNKQAKIWNEYLEHDTYDDYWKSRNIRAHLKNIKSAVLIVGGWFDAEDLFGALHTFKAIREQSPANNNISLVMGPWRHGEWFGMGSFGFPTYNSNDLKNQNQFYHEEIETKFFNYYLKDKGDFNPSQATIFNTGSNEWKEYNSWPPMETKPQTFYLQEDGKISNASSPKSFDEYISDPENPVPYTRGIYGNRNSNYMVEDQRFAEQRKDVLTYKTDTLTSDLTVAGPLKVDLFISTTGSDADFIVKLIDVLPDNEPGFETNYRLNGVRHSETHELAGVERLQRAEVFRSKFRNSYEKPEPLIPGQITEIKFDMNDIAHTFKKGHRIMVQVQSSWFPLVDINPQKFVDIPSCNKNDFQKTTIRVYHNSSVILPVVQ
ncbi:MAG TPA: CocE/NonD family hydrolase [Puia sp.]|nr:CocE/NonD family hydrolase [Puia sp.]